MVNNFKGLENKFSAKVGDMVTLSGRRYVWASKKERISSESKSMRIGGFVVYVKMLDKLHAKACRAS